MIQKCVIFRGLTCSKLTIKALEKSCPCVFLAVTMSFAHMHPDQNHLFNVNNTDTRIADNFEQFV